MAGLPLLSTSEGILCRSPELYHRRHSAVHTGGGGVDGGGRMGITHRWPLSASNQSHTHSSHLASRKTTGSAGIRIHHNLYHAHVFTTSPHIHSFVILLFVSCELLTSEM